MGFIRMNVLSQALSQYVDISIALPMENFSYFPPEAPRHHIMPGQPPKPQYKPGIQFQTIYLLQGGEADDMYMFRHANIERYARENNVIVVSPRIANSFGVDTAYGIEYSAFCSEELPAMIQTLFPSSPLREDNFVMGAAAGGNCALYNAVRFPEKYSVCVDMSGGIGEHFGIENMSGMGRMNNFPIARTSFCDPDKLEGSVYDMVHLTKQHQEAGNELSKLIFIHGSEEGRIGESVKRDAEYAKKLGYDTEYYCVEEGKHCDEFWDTEFGVIMRDILPLKRQAWFKD